MKWGYNGPCDVMLIMWFKLKLPKDWKLGFSVQSFKYRITSEVSSSYHHSYFPIVCRGLQGSGAGGGGVRRVTGVGRCEACPWGAEGASRGEAQDREVTCHGHEGARAGQSQNEAHWGGLLVWVIFFVLFENFSLIWRSCHCWWMRIFTYAWHSRPFSGDGS